MKTAPLVTGVARDDGFTLIEMIVTLTIIALTGAALTMVVSPSNLAASPRDTARQISSLARTASTRATLEGRETLLTVDLVKRIVSINAGTETVALPAHLTVSMTVSEHLVAPSQHGSIAFFPDGASTGGEIAIGNALDDVYRVRIFWITGDISVERTK
jgi:general secretion pathway protein H